MPITVCDNVFSLDTADTSYRILVNEHKHPEQVYYGPRIDGCDLDALRYKRTILRGSQVVTDPDDPAYCLDETPLEWSGIGRGDYRVSPLEARMPNGAFVCEFLYEGHEILPGILPLDGLPQAAGEAETLVLHLKEAALDVRLSLVYTVFADTNVITRRAVVENREERPMELRKMMSMLLDLPPRAWVMSTFDGDWIRETNRHDRLLTPGMFVNESTTGASGNRHNAGILLSERSASETHGLVYGFNLVYSGNHHTAVEQSPCGLVRVITGVSPHCFSWTLGQGERFQTPEAVLTCSDAGFGGASRHFHAFVNRHIVRGQWQGKERPILCNNWEAHMFSFHERQLLSLARRAKKLGAELFVLDDGWYGKRNDDHAGLGDYTVNRKKLPHGIDGLARRVNRMGLAFGLWFEPESVNEDSDLFRAHPEYAVCLPDRAPARGRNQLVLDLCNPAVRTYLVESVGRVLDSARIAYVKWDMNRHISDMYSSCCDTGEFFHRYMLGLYEVLTRIFGPRPHILLESCSSGGNRFDLGMLCFSPQAWASDDTDPVERLRIQTGLSHLYPTSCMGAHVSQSPHAQTLRSTPLATRFGVAAFGAFGYELDFAELTRAERREVAAQIAFYKQYRRVFQYGTFYRLITEKANKAGFLAVSADRKTAVALLMQGQAEAAEGNDILRLEGLEPDARYRVTARPQAVFLKGFGGLVKHILPLRLKPDGLVLRTANRLFSLTDGRQTMETTGRVLRYGVALDRQFIGTGYHKDLRMWGDYGSTLYVIEQVEAA